MKILLMTCVIALTILSACGSSNSSQSADNQQNNRVESQMTDDIIAIDKESTELDSINAEIDSLMKDIDANQ